MLIRRCPPAGEVDCLQQHAVLAVGTGELRIAAENRCIGAGVTYEDLLWPPLVACHLPSRSLPPPCLTKAKCLMATREDFDSEKSSTSPVVHNRSAKVSGCAVRNKITGAKSGTYVGDWDGRAPRNPRQAMQQNIAILSFNLKLPCQVSSRLRSLARPPEPAAAPSRCAPEITPHPPDVADPKQLPASSGPSP